MGDEEAGEEGDDTEDDEEEEDDEDDDEEEEEEETEAYTMYSDFYGEYAKSIKLGVIDDKANKGKLVKLLRYVTNLSPDKPISLDRYVDGMADDQRHIYFISGETSEDIMNSPLLEKVEELDYEVIIMIDPVDEYLIQQLTEYEGTPMQNLVKDGLSLGDQDKM